MQQTRTTFLKQTGILLLKKLSADLLKLDDDWAYQSVEPTFGGDPVPDTNSGSFFRFPRHCGTGF